MPVLPGVRSWAATAKTLYTEDGHLLIEIDHLSCVHQDRKKKSGCLHIACDSTLLFESEMGVIVSTHV